MVKFDVRCSMLNAPDREWSEEIVVEGTGAGSIDALCHALAKGLDWLSERPIDLVKGRRTHVFDVVMEVSGTWVD